MVPPSYSYYSNILPVPYVYTKSGIQFLAVL